MLEKLKALFAGSGAKNAAMHGNGWKQTEGTLTDTAFWANWRNGEISQAERLATVFACVRVISESIAQMPLVLYRRKSDGSREIAADHSVSRLLRDGPNQMMTSFEWKEFIAASVLLHGRSPHQVIRSPVNDKLLEINPLAPSSLTFSRTSNGIQFRYLDGKVISRDELAIVSYRKTNPLDPWGRSVIDFNRATIDAGISAQQYGEALLKSQGRLRGVVTLPLKMSEIQMDEWRSGWKKTYSDESDNSVAIIPEGGSYTQLGVTAEDMQYMEQRRATRHDICGMMGVPPHKIGDLDGAKYDNVEHQNISFVQEAVIPNGDRIVTSFNRDLLMPAERDEYYFEFNTNALLMGDSESRMKMYKGLFELGALSTNDILQRENMQKVSDGDARYVSTNLMKLGLDYVPKGNADAP